MSGMDSVRKPKTRATQAQESHSTPPPQHNTAPTGLTPEMKVWLSIVGSCLVIVAVWIATFSLPRSSPDKPSASASQSEIKEILSELRDSIQTGMKVVDQQKTTLSQLASNINKSPTEDTLSNDELKALAAQLVGSLNATTTTSTVPAITPTTPSSPKQNPNPKLP